MTNLTKISLFFLITHSLISYSQDSVHVSEKLQTKTLHVLKSMDTLSLDQYLKQYILLDNYKSLARNKEGLNPYYKNEILDITRSSWVYYREIEYRNLKEQAALNGIVWKDITFEDFEYYIMDERGFNWLEGTIYFKHNNEIHEMRVYSIRDHAEYQIFSLKM